MLIVENPVKSPTFGGYRVLYHQKWGQKSNKRVFWSFGWSYHQPKHTQKILDKELNLRWGMQLGSSPVKTLGKWCFKCYLPPKLSSPNCSALKLDVRTYLICMQRKSRSWSTSNGTSALSTCHGMTSIQNHRASSEHQDAHHLLHSTNIEYETKVIIWRTKIIQAYFLVADLISALRK